MPRPKATIGREFVPWGARDYVGALPPDQLGGRCSTRSGKAYCAVPHLVSEALEETPLITQPMSF